MIENNLVWSLDVLVAYTNGTTQSGTILQDFGTPRYINITSEQDFLTFIDVVNEPAFAQFMTALGYSVTPASNPNYIADYQFGFSALSANGGTIHIAGSSKDLAANILSDNLPAITTILHADPNFNAIFTALAAA